MNREQLMQWTDTAAHAEWLETRNITRKSGVNLPESLKTAAMERLERILIDDSHPPEIHIRAIDSLAKLASVQVSAATATANVLTRHIQDFNPAATDRHSLYLADILESLAPRNGLPER